MLFVLLWDFRLYGVLFGFYRKLRRDAADSSERFQLFYYGNPFLRLS
jgi:hypothetical protein